MYAVIGVNTLIRGKEMYRINKITLNE